MGEIQIAVEGPDLSKLEKYEPGGHRIQRVPPTERKGRVHTSTVTVAVIDPASKSLDFPDSDFTIEWYSGTGAGGQHRNKHQNSARVTHIPTGMKATAQCRTRQNSLTEAKTELIRRLTEAHSMSVGMQIASTRKDQVGSGMRGDKIRTIRFQDDSAIDHRTSKRITAKKYLNGGMDSLWV